ncbi:MAG: sulfatase [Deltaproteobacteria bacterium]|nr:sulfatase [Deltaproteobacteria bacterium]MBW2051974.1 sulfatase [Deltaproteobacteria bacterium]MBW2141072.1 sulfatase [Deltaproteobacteria bacterium]
MNSVLLISIDTLRADHLSCYGYPRRTSPNLDRLAREAALFEYAFAPCSYTVPSFTSMMTSRWPSWHTAKLYFQAPCALTPEMVPLAELMAASGYRTAAFISTVVLNRQNSGLDRGFEIYNQDITVPELNRPMFLYRQAKDTIEAASAWLQDIADEPFFLWIHLMDVHGPYNPPPPHDSHFINDGSDLTPFDRFHLPLIKTPITRNTAPEDYVPGIPAYQVLGFESSPNEGSPPNYESRFRRYLDRYDGAIHYTDLAIGRLLAMLKSRNCYDNTFVIVHSDHGEAFGEQGVFFFHGLTVTRDQIHVPLIIKAGQLAPGRYTDPVSLCDIMPFLVEALDLNDPGGMMGRSLISPPDPQRLIPSQILRQLAVINNENLYLYGDGWFESPENDTLFETAEGLHFLERSQPCRRYKYRKDPLSYHPLDPGQDKVRVNAWAHDFVSEANTQIFKSEPLIMDEKETSAITERLRSLGYLD